MESSDQLTKDEIDTIILGGSRATNKPRKLHYHLCRALGLVTTDEKGSYYIAMHKLLTRYRKSRGRSLHSYIYTYCGGFLYRELHIDSERTALRPPEACGLLESVPCSGKSPEDLIEETETILGALSHPKEHEAVRRNVIEEATCENIANDWRCSRAYVSFLVQRGLQNLRRRWEPSLSEA